MLELEPLVVGVGVGVWDAVDDAVLDDVTVNVQLGEAV